jgi:hypothetical protein
VTRRGLQIAFARAFTVTPLRGGAIMIGGQKIQAGLVHARKTAEVTVEADT